MYFLYILECKDGSLYTGITTDIERRFAEHKSGKGGRYTRAKGVQKILYSRAVGSKSAALKHELDVKKFSRSAKIKLIQGGKKVSSTLS